MRKLLTAALPALLIAAPALAQTPGPRSGERADVPMLGGRDAIRTFTADRDGRGVYLQDRSKNWYYASFFGRCNELPFAYAVGVKSWSSFTLSRGDSILVRGERCTIADLVRSGPPPKKEKAKKAKPAA